ncbi:MAG: cytochrome c [Bacteroidetes bacterium]|nr:cytochrome c [Bacteroidota bacterium]
MATGLFTFSSCYYDSKEYILGGISICDTTNTQFASVVNPIITQNCTACHGGSAPSAGISLEGYANVKNNYTAILNSINNGSMPKGSSKLDDCTILKIQTWVNRGAQNN